MDFPDKIIEAEIENTPGSDFTNSILSPLRISPISPKNLREQKQVLKMLITDDTPMKSEESIKEFIYISAFTDDEKKYGPIKT